MFLDYLSAFENWEKPAFLEGNMFPIRSEKRFVSKRYGLQKSEQRTGNKSLTFFLTDPVFTL